MKMVLKRPVIRELSRELKRSQMLAFYLLSSGTAMSELVTKLDLTGIIVVLCKKLGWVVDLNQEIPPCKTSLKVEEGPITENEAFQSTLLYTGTLAECLAKIHEPATEPLPLQKALPESSHDIPIQQVWSLAQIILLTASKIMIMVAIDLTLRQINNLFSGKSKIEIVVIPGFDPI